MLCDGRTKVCEYSRGHQGRKYGHDNQKTRTPDSGLTGSAPGELSVLVVWKEPKKPGVARSGLPIPGPLIPLRALLLSSPHTLSMRRPAWPMAHVCPGLLRRGVLGVHSERTLYRVCSPYRWACIPICGSTDSAGSSATHTPRRWARLEKGQQLPTPAHMPMRFRVAFLPPGTN